MKRLRWLFVLLLFPLLAIPGRAANADTTAIFGIGTHDGSDAEFALAPSSYAQYPARFPQDVNYTVGSSTPDQDWSYVEPGPADAWAGSRAHAFTITYDLSSVPAGDPQLVVWYLDTNENSPPTTRVISNGTEVKTVNLPAGGGGGVFGESPQRPYTLGVLIPASTLKTGTNTLTIQNTGGSWTIYDAAELLPPPSPGAPPDVSIDTATPTPLFANTAGQPQIVNVSVFNDGNAGDVTFTADTDGAKTTTTVNVPYGPSTQQIGVVPASGADPANLTITSSAGGSVQLRLPHQRRWQLYLLHGSHQDIGYTDTQPIVRQHQDQYIDTAVQQCQQTAGAPSDDQFHWTIEHAWMLENYVADRPTADVQAVAACLRSGQFELAGSYDNQLFDLSSSEQMARALYAGTRTLADRFGIHPDAAIQDDVTGVTWQDIQVLAKSGIKYLMNGANPTRAPRPENTPALFWWKAPNGSKVLTWYSDPNSYGEGYNFLNQPASQLDNAVAGAESLLSGLQNEGYPRDIYPIQMFLDNRPPVTTLPDLVSAWNQKYSYPRLIFSTPTPFFRAISQESPDSIPTYGGDWSGWWSDGAASSAHETAQTREAQTRTTTAETLGALSSLTTPADQDRQATLDEAYQQGELYTEHTWGAANPSYDDPEWPYKQNFAVRADQLSGQALTAATGDLAGQMQNSSSWPEVSVFNSLSWARSGEVKAAVPEGELGGRPFRLLDADGNVVPYELVSTTGGNIVLRFVATDVPSVGYATYRLVPTSETGGETPVVGSDPALHADSAGLENRYFRIALDPTTGTITSIYDKARGQELLDRASPFTGNQFVYRPNCAGADKFNACPTSAARQWSPTSGSVRVLSSGPVSATVEVTADPGAGGATTGISGLTQRITLYADTPRVDISDTVNKVRVDTAEEAYFAFPFKVDNPQVTYEIPDGSARFFTDQLPGSALDWQAIQSYADVSNGSGGVTFSSPDAPLVEFDHIRTQEFLTRPGRLDGTPFTVDPSKYLPKNGSIFPYAYNNLWFTNYRIAQAGPTTFHYAITSHAGGFDAVRDTRAGQGAQTPLVPVGVGGRQDGAYNPGDHSLISLDQPNVVVQTIKRAYGGAPGLTVRLREVAGRSVQTNLHLPFQVGAATMDDLTERPQSALSTRGNVVQVPVEANGIVTLTVLPQLVVNATAPTTTIARGHGVPVTVSLVNNSHQTLSGSLSLSQQDGLTISPASAAFSGVAPGDTASAVFTVTAPAATPTGAVTLTAAANGGASVTPAKLTLNVVNPVSVVATPSHPDLVEGMSTQVQVTATNNLDETTDATVRLDAPSGWTVEPASPAVTLAAGQSQTVAFTVTPPAGSFGRSTLRAVAEGGGATSTVDLPAAVSRPVAIVGQRDLSQNEFALAPDQFDQYPAKFPGDVDFTYGTSTPATDWSYIEPGPEDIWAGSRAHTFTFRFDLSQAPPADLTFTAWLLDTNNFHAPTVQVGLNGGSATTVSLPPGGGDGYHWGSGPNMYGGIQPTSFDVTLPQSQLHTGQNTVTITDNSGSWIVYDAFGVRQKPTE